MYAILYRNNEDCNRIKIDGRLNWRKALHVAINEVRKSDGIFTKVEIIVNEKIIVKKSIVYTDGIAYLVR